MFATQNWYCACRSDELGSALKSVRIIKQDLVLFRNQQGLASCIGAMCAHRGGNLADGRCVNGRVQCPWHGWQYSGTGQCELIPSLGEAGRIPGLARVPAYRVHEADGIVYVWMNAEVEPGWKPDTHEFLNARYQVSAPSRLQLGNYINTIESACDDSHVHLAHRNTIGRGFPARLAPITNVVVNEDERYVAGDMRWPSDLKRRASFFDAWLNKQLFGLTEDSGTHDKTFRVELTGLVIHQMRKSDGHDFVVYAFITPVDETHNIFVSGVVDTNPNRSLIGNLIYLAGFRNLASKVFDEDEAVISSALSETLPGGHPCPVSVNADAIGLGFRRLYANQVRNEGGQPAWPVAHSK